MNIKIKNTNIESNSIIEEYLYKRLDGLKKLINPHDESANVYVELAKTTQHHKAGVIFKAEINLHIAGKNFNAVAEKEDLYVAIDEMRDEIMRDLRSWKGKQHSLLKRGGIKIKNIIKGLYKGKSE